MTDKLMADKAMQGGCQCGAVKYEVTGKPFGVEYCHCSMCRKTVGAVTVNWIDLKVEQVKWVTQMPKEYASSEHAFRGFCAECGGSISFRDSRRPEYLSLTIGSLDDPSLVEPTQHIYADDKVKWLNIVDECTRFGQGAV
ncbi:MAG: GFA family protein [Psychrosphaera sp.]|nr:GFA family protein [Psychrosphaera sp.]